MCRVLLRDWPCNSYTRSSREQWEIHHPDLRYFLPPFQHLVDHLPWVSQWGFKLWLWILAPYSVTPELITLSSHSLIASLRQETGRHLLLLFPIEPTESYGVYLQDSPFSPFLLPLPMCGVQVYLANLSSSWLRMSPPVSSILTARNISSYTAVLTAPLSCPFTLPPQNTLSLASWKKKIRLDTHLTPYTNINSWQIQDLNDYKESEKKKWKVLQETMGEFVLISKGLFWVMTETIKERTEKSAYIKIEIWCVAKT